MGYYVNYPPLALLLLEYSNQEMNAVVTGNVLNFKIILLYISLEAA